MIRKKAIIAQRRKMRKKIQILIMIDVFTTLVR